MEISSLLIHLHNSVDAFALKPRHLEHIRQALPGVNIHVAKDTLDFLDKLPGAECALVWVFKAEWYERAANLKALFTPAAGHDWVAADPSGRVPTIYGSFHGRIMRESLLSMMLYFNRNLAKSLRDQKNRTWGRFDYNGCDGLFNQRVVIVGYGALGRSMAELLNAFGAKVTGVKRNLSLPEDSPFVDRLITFEKLYDELAGADHVVLVLPGGASTEGVFTEQHFKAMKPGSYLYNLGRGTCYREDDLLCALEHGPMAGAGLDVFAEEPLPADSPLWEMPNVLLTPHSSAISREYIDLFIQEWLEKLQRIE